MAPLDRAVTLAEMHDAAVRVGEHLDLDVPRIVDVLLDIDGCVSKVRLALTLRGRECTLDLHGAPIARSWTRLGLTAAAGADTSVDKCLATPPPIEGDDGGTAEVEMLAAPSVHGSLTFNDDRLLAVPIIIPQGQPNEKELENLAHYLLAGGFVMAEDHNFEGFWVEALEKYGGLVAGRDFHTERLAADHPIFTAYFDLGDGVALGATRFDDPYYWNVVQGLYVKGRLAAVPRANAGIGGYLGFASGRDSTRILQFAVNTVVYALTQEGSMTQRLMQMVH